MSDAVLQFGDYSTEDIPAGPMPGAYAAPPMPSYRAPQPPPTSFGAPFTSSYAAPTQPGSFSQSQGYSSSYSGSSGFDDEPPLLEELGINFQHIKEKTVAVLHPTQQLNTHIMDDTDLAGPLLFCLMFGAALLASGKIQFGYVYGVAAVGCLGLYSVLSLMSDVPLSMGRTASVLGYSLLPMVALSSISILLSLTGIIGTVLSIVSVAWCTYSASRIFVVALSMQSQHLLIAYPCALLYGVFALLTVF